MSQVKENDSFKSFNPSFAASQVSGSSSHILVVISKYKALALLLKLVYTSLVVVLISSLYPGKYLSIFESIFKANSKTFILASLLNSSKVWPLISPS